MPTTPGGRGLGVRFAPPDPRNWSYPHTRSLAVGAPHDIDLRARMQPVGNQGQLGSCTGWAGTAALEAKLGDGQRSPLYVYYYDRFEDGTAPGSDAGATMLALCKALKDWGAPPEDAWPYQNGLYFQTEPDMDARIRTTRIDAYYQIQGSGQSLLQGIWGALEQGDTPAIALNIYAEFEYMGRDGKAPMPRTGSQVLGGHAITACGWFNDNSAPGGYGWVMAQNSWGEEFGDQGYVYLPAAYFISGIVREGWVIAVSAPVPPPPVPEPDVDLEAVLARLDQMENCVDAAQADRCVYNATKAAYQVSMARIMDHDIGPIRDLVRECRELLPKVDPPGPEPTPTAITGVAVTYAGHDPARDVYLGYSEEQVAWGPHHGIPFIAPCDGTVSLYTFPTPLPTLLAVSHQRAQTYIALFGDAEELICGMKAADLIATGQTMYFVLFVPNVPIMGLRAMWFGHARGNAKLGPVKQGEWFGESWDSGVHFESVGISARAAHVHCCASANGQLTMNGDVDGLQAATAMGWKVQFIGNGPGPKEYYSGLYTAGRQRTDFDEAGRDLPPMPS